MEYENDYRDYLNDGTITTEHSDIQTEEQELALHALAYEDDYRNYLNDEA